MSRHDGSRTVLQAVCLGADLGGLGPGWHRVEMIVATHHGVTRYVQVVPVGEEARFR